MSTVPCPHCGFQNFTISAYCARCERPLKDAQPLSEALRKATRDPAPNKVPPAPPPAQQRPLPSAQEVAAAIMARRPPAATPPQPPAEPVLEKTVTEIKRPPLISPRAGDGEAATLITPRLDRPEPDTVITQRPAPPAAAAPAPAPMPASRTPSAARLRPTPQPQPRAATPSPPPRRATAPPPRPPDPLSDTMPDPQELVRAAGWRLLLSHLVDLTLVLAAAAAYTVLDAAIFGPAWSGGHGSLLDRAAEWVTLYPGPTVRGAVVALLTGTVYHALMNQRSGRTLGRRLAGTELVRGSGRPMSWIVVVLRTVMSWVSLAFFGAGYFWAIVDSKGRGWHDLLAGTVVVRRRVRVN